MAIKTGTSRNVFVSGRGNVSANVAKSDAEVLANENESTAPLVDSKDNPAGRKPVFAAGDMPFHSGRGAGRGHS
jgi:hypothetical protein